jgi:Domain of unknown function (DUF4398)
MNKISLTPIHKQSKAYTALRVSVALALTLSVSGLAACGGISDLTKERVSRSAVAVQQTQQTLGRSEEGAIELQRAKESLEAAQRAVAKSDEKGAQRHASQAELYAELAVAQAQSAEARRAANEVLASTEALRNESERSGPTTTTTR